MFGDEDLAAIFSESGEFTTLGTFSNAIAVWGIFTEPTKAATFLGGEIETLDPTFECLTDLVSSITNDSVTVVINSVTYTVKRKERIGDGRSLIYLKT